MTLIHAPAGLKSRPPVAWSGQGSARSSTSPLLRKIAGAATRYLKSRSIKKFAFLVRENDLSDNTAQAVVEGAITADFETDKYKSDKKPGKDIESIAILGYNDSNKSAGEKGLDHGPDHRRIAKFRPRPHQRAFE